MLDISIDLHLHLDGSLSLDTVKRLAKMQNMTLPEDDDKLKELLTVRKGCRDLAEYLTKFDFPLSLLQTAEAIEEGTYLLCKELLNEGCIYAEIRFAPQLHLLCGLSQEQVVKAAIKGFERSGLLGGLILCCMRGNDNRAQNFGTVVVAKKYLGKGVLALDLAGNEAGFPTGAFEDIFEASRKERIPFTVHAGEADGAASVKKAIEMGAARIGHGVRSIEDEEVLKLLTDKKIPLELCPTSNLNTAIFSDINEYPVRKLMDKGVIVTVNSDNRSVSDTTAQKEIELIKSTFKLTESEEKQLFLNSVNAAFCGGDIKRKLVKMIE